MKLLPLPDNFDKNEWFLVISLIISYVSILFLKRKFHSSIFLLLIVFSACIARIADFILAGPGLDMYDLMDTKYFDLTDLLTYLLYGPFAIVFIYIYEKFNLTGIKTFIYILVFSTIGTAFEYLTVIFKVFTFKEWKSFYSFNVYLIVQLLTLIFYHFVKKYYK
ncbi:hypothetical protein [Bacillus kwashiorkori]|uniref:hypothetical protein n=1 Tax=Bacillus kwashiorkori TaxID=1522318 RepID=UPI0007843872|nr:hypothetical protein [Bacillus kwashiorkori]